MAPHEDPEDTGSDLDLMIPEVYGFFRGATLSWWGKTKIILQQTWKALFGDAMTQFILYSTFVNALLKAKLGTMVYLWYTSWSIPDDVEPIYDY